MRSDLMAVALLSLVSSVSAQDLATGPDPLESTNAIQLGPTAGEPKASSPDLRHAQTAPSSREAKLFEDEQRPPQAMRAYFLGAEAGGEAVAAAKDFPSR